MQPLPHVRHAFHKYKVHDSELCCDVLLHCDVERTLNELGVHPPRDELQSYLEDNDSNDAACLTWGEFKQVYWTYYRMGVDPLKLCLRFMAMDAAHSGIITKDDVAAFSKPAGATEAEVNSAGLPSRPTTGSLCRSLSTLSSRCPKPKCARS